MVIQPCTNRMNLDFLPKLRQKQLIHAKYKEFIIDLDNIKVLPKDLKNELKAQNFEILSIKPIRSIVSKDKNTIKTLFERTSDNLKFESVLMRYNDGRNSACLSCMVGCPLNCSFCATGKMGFKANLTSDEIADQLIFWNALLKNDNQQITNVVYMGMGEPLLNLNNVLESINIISSPDYIGLSQKRITISTSGIIKGINDLAAANFKGDLALSLHSAVQDKRELIMPIAKTNKLPELIESLHNYTKTKRTRITFEYILIKGINDSEADAQKLIEIVKEFDALVNLIPYNKIIGCDFERPSNNTIFKFKRLLDNNNIFVTLRLTMGSDTGSACGQLTTNNG